MGEAVKKILLVKSRHTGVLGEHHAIAPPMGILCLAAYVRRERPGMYDFVVLDERIRRMSDHEWRLFLERLRPDLIGVSALSVEAERSAALARLFKSLAPEVPVVLGGPYPSSAGEQCFSETEADAVVIGEGEKPFLQLLDRLMDLGFHVRAMRGLDVPGVVVRECDQSPGPGHIVMDLDDLPDPAFDLVDLEEYFNVPRMTPLNARTRYLPLYTSRGCPYRCIYCHDIFGKRFRTMSPHKVVGQIERYIHKYGVHSFEIFDDIFNLDRKRVLDICREIRRRDLRTEFSFPNALRGDLLDEEVLRELRSVGTYFMALAVETASRRLQRMLKKNIDLDKIKRNIELASSMGIVTTGFFMVGFPTETRRELFDTLMFALGSKLHLAFFFVVIPFEGTGIAELARQAGTYGDGTKGIVCDYDYAKHNLSENYTRFELHLARNMALLAFYLNPRRAWRLWKDYPASRWELVMNALGMLQQITILQPRSWLARLLESTTPPLASWRRSAGP